MAVRFDAAGDRCTWTGTAPTPSSGLTITFWAHVSVDRDDFSTMLRLHSASGATTNANIAMDSGGMLPCVFTAGGSSTGPQPLVVGQWARIAVTVTGSTSTIYVAQEDDGATQSQAGTVGGNAGVSPDSGYTLAGRSAVDSSEWYNGRLAHLRLWSTVLSQGDIEAEWAASEPIITTNLFADYPLIDAGDLLDHSGNSRHLTAGSSSVTTEDGPPIVTAITATIGVTLPALATNLPGAMLTAGQHAAALPALDADLTGGISFSGQILPSLPALGATLAGGAATAGQLGAALPALDTESAGGLTVTGTTTNLLPSLVAALGGSTAAPVTVTVAVTLPSLTMASGRAVWPPAVTDAPSSAQIGVDGPHDVPWISVS